MDCYVSHLNVTATPCWGKYKIQSSMSVGVRVRVLSSCLFWTSDVWTHQPGPHRRKVTQDFSTFLLRCLPYFFSREGFIHPFPSSTMKSNFVYPRVNRSPCWALFFIFYFLFSSCDCTEIRTHIPKSEGFEVTNWTTGERELVLTDNTVVTTSITTVLPYPEGG